MSRLSTAQKHAKHSVFNILVATPLYPPEIGGPATFTRFVETELPKRGIGVAVEKFSDMRQLPKIIRYIVYFWRLLGAGGKADVILALDPLGIGLPAMLAAWVRRRRFFVRVAGDRAWETLQSKVSQEFPISNNQSPTTPQFSRSQIPTVEDFQKQRWGLRIELRRVVQRFVTRRAERVIVPSEFLKRIVLTWGVSEEKISVVYNSFDPPQGIETKEEARRALGLSGSIIVSAGRLVPWKGFDALIAVMPQILRDVPGARLVIIGDGPEREQLEQQARALREDSVGAAASSKQRAITFLGRLPQRELHRYIRAADVFVLNSGYEGFSHQLLEAMVLGTPVVVSDIPGNRELVEDEKNGLIVRYGDSDALSATVTRLLKNQSLAAKLAGAAREVVQTFNVTSAAGCLLAALGRGGV